MKLKFKSKKIRGKILIFGPIFTIIICLVILVLNLTWNTLDYKLNDVIYKHNILEGNGPAISKNIVILNITDNTYKYFKKNYLDREDLAKINKALLNLNPQSVFYDIIFPRPSTEKSDTDFAKSIKLLGNVCLPVGLNLSSQKTKFKWNTGFFYQSLTKKKFGNIKEIGKGSPFYAIWAVAQMNIFAKETESTGNISIIKDNDGILRHVPMVVKIDSLYFPTAMLQMFLDYDQISFNKIEIKWGNYIIIPKVKGSYLENKILIPIDKKGRMFIPYPAFWLSPKVKMMPAENFLKLSEKGESYDALLNFFEGNFVFVSDISVGSSDLGETTLESSVPLVTMHTAILNALLNNTFYSEWKKMPLVVLIFFCGIILSISSFTKSNLTLYISSIAILAGLIFFANYEAVHYQLFPLATSGMSVILISIGLLLTLNILITKDQKFIRNAFSKYVPDKVVNELLEKPELLKLGGEERVLTIFFSDIQGFTTISESLVSQKLVPLLNEYLTEMTEIIIKNKGTVDKFIGDAILAEFGMPIYMEDHSDCAVESALLMHRRLIELDKSWSRNELPSLKARIGINTGRVVVGNMGSENVFDYTVIGDPVNLASRLEGANKLYNTSILISEATYKDLGKSKFQVRVVDIVKVKGKTKAVKIYEPYAFSDDKVLDNDKYYFELYEKGFELYLQRDFANAKVSFEKCLAHRQSDKLSLGMIKRIDGLNPDTLDEHWDGSIALNEK
jgi:adenylate cyclase